MLNLRKLVEKFGQYKEVPSRKEEVRFNCPYCVEIGKPPDTKFHLYINLVKGVGHCFRCGRSVNLRRLLDFKEVKREALEKPAPSKITSVFNYGDLVLVPATSVSVVVDYFTWRFRKVLTEEEVIERLKRFNVSFCVGVKDKRFRRFIGKVCVPIYMLGELVCVQFRSIFGETPKYLSFSVNGTNIKDAIFNFDRALEAGSIWVMEGVMDVIATFNSAVCVFGKELTETQLRLIAYNFSEVNIAFDGDAFNDALKVGEELKKRGVEKVTVYKPPIRADPADLGKDGLMRCEKIAL